MSVVDKHVPLNRMAAQQSIVLIKNKKSLLPLKMSNYKSVALIGPCADDVTCARGVHPHPQADGRVLLMKAVSVLHELLLVDVFHCSQVTTTQNQTILCPQSKPS